MQVLTDITQQMEQNKKIQHLVSRHFRNTTRGSVPFSQSSGALNYGLDLHRSAYILIRPHTYLTGKHHTNNYSQPHILQEIVLGNHKYLIPPRQVGATNYEKISFDQSFAQFDFVLVTSGRICKCSVDCVEQVGHESVLGGGAIDVGGYGQTG